MRSAADGALAGLAVTGRAGSVVNVRRCDMVRVPGGWCGASVEAWNGRRGHDVMTGPVCEECEQAQQRCRRQTSAPDDKSRPVSLASGRRARGCPRTCGTRCRSSATARSSNRAAIGRQCAKEGPGLVLSRSGVSFVSFIPRTCPTFYFFLRFFCLYLLNGE